MLCPMPPTGRVPGRPLGARLRRVVPRLQHPAQVVVAGLIQVGGFGIMALATLLGLLVSHKGVQPRTAGFNSINTGELNPETLLGTDVLMFIGGGSVGTAGGIKVTTFAVLLVVIVIEVRGDQSVTAFSPRIPREVQRQALSVALLAVVVAGTGLLLTITDFSLDQVLFEVVSAFATVGLSTGITAQVGTAGQLVLATLIFVGRLGPITLAAALALRTKPRLYDLPYERPIIG